MPGQAYTIGAFSPVHIQENVGREMMVYNSGSVTVYLDDYPGATSSRGFPLSAGATKIWDADTPLYAITASGSGILNVTTNIGGLFDPTAIASGITGGTTLSPSAVAAAINALGVPVVDKPVALYSGNFVVNDVGTGNDTSTAVFDVTQYQSISLTIFHPSGDTDVTHLREVNVTWYADAAGLIPINTDTWTFAAYADLSFASLMATMPVRGPYVQFTAVLHVPAYPSQTWKLYMYGFLRVLPARSIIQSLAVSSGGLFNAQYPDVYMFSGGVPLGTTTTDYPDTTPGPAVLSIYVNSTTDQIVRATLCKRDDLLPTLGGVTIPAGTRGGNSFSVALILPRYPVVLQVQNQSATGGYNLRGSITMGGAIV